MTHFRKFGWKPNLPDPRSKKYSLAYPNRRTVLELPSLVDLRPDMSPIEDQGQLGSCVAHATAANLEYLELQELKLHNPGVEILSPTQFNPISRLFVYYNARSLDGDTNRDEGTTLSSAVKSIQKWGISRESYWPYDPSKVLNTPSSSSYREGASHIIIDHYELDNSQINELKECLFLKNPFILGISVFGSFMSEEVASTGMVPLPSHSEELQGGHALCAVGYDDNTNGGSFIIRNSWGSSWGIKGYCYIPYSYLTNKDLASDFWTIKK